MRMLKIYPNSIRSVETQHVCNMISFTRSTLIFKSKRHFIIYIKRRLRTHRANEEYTPNDTLFSFAYIYTLFL